jgi:antitoxin component YwqK of YwqJK toxin-antitoxin module
MKFILLLALILTSSISYSQKNKKNINASFSKEKSAYKISYREKNTSNFRQKNRSYFYFFKGGVIETQGANSGHLLHGAYEVKYPSNQLKEKGTFHFGLKSGQWLTWYENGKLKEEQHWRDGKLVGLHTYFDTDGFKVRSTRYFMGKEKKVFPKMEKVKKEKKKKVNKEANTSSEESTQP